METFTLTTPGCRDRARLQCRIPVHRTSFSSLTGVNSWHRVDTVWSVASHGYVYMYIPHCNTPDNLLYGCKWA